MRPPPPDVRDEQSYMLGPEVEMRDRDSAEYENSSKSMEHGAPTSIRRVLDRIIPSSSWVSRQREPYRDIYDTQRYTGKLKRRCWSHPFVRILLFSPIILLSFFGLIHLLRVELGGEGLLWSLPEEDDFWPDYGKPGKAGEDVAHYPTDVTRDVIPIPCHSHNDYWRRIPFYEAVHYGCIGVEADVWLKGNDELYVGHSVTSLTRNRTFNAMYIEPILKTLTKQNPSTEFGSAIGHGVFDEDPDQTLVLLVDFKTGGEETWSAVLQHLGPLRDGNYLSFWNGTSTQYRAVTVVATGNAPFNLITANETYRDVFFDAPLDKLSLSAFTPHQVRGQGDEGTNGTKPDDFNPATSFYASTSLIEAVGKISHGRFTAKQLQTVRSQIKDAHRQGLKARYWETPAWPIGLRNYVWRTLIEEGVDMLNVDDLRSAARVDWRRKPKHDMSIPSPF